ncbi:unnamed protein product [Chironomus riparius]|uniref:Uncharacterized protein n=1 Tax=Chironomus riparius TaxID=315576 RepID=A0A9N9S1Y4_9DIPT|nr:unnamed protein product [Chironomus riparius]
MSTVNLIVLILLNLLLQSHAEDYRDIQLTCKKNFYITDCEILDDISELETTKVVNVAAPDEKVKLEKYFRVSNKSFPINMPIGIGELFPNLELLSIVLSPLKFIKRRNFASMEKLTTLDLRYNKIEKVPSKTFYDLPKLTTLNLSGNSIKFLHLDLFLNNPELEEFAAAKNEIKKLSFQTFQKSLKLKRFNVSFNNFQSISFDFTKLPNLTDVVFKNSFECNFEFKIDRNDHADCTHERCTHNLKRFQFWIEKYCAVVSELTGDEDDSPGPDSEKD